MLLTHIPRIQSHFSTAITIPPSSFHSTTSRLFLLLKPKSKPTVSHAPKSSTSSFSTSTTTTTTTTTTPLTTPFPTSETPEIEETHIQISIEKLFIPPDTDVSSINNVPLTTRVLKGSNIVLSKYAKDAQVVQAEFVKSSTKTEECPSDGLPEFALVGRSNVGKSSLLNSIVRRKKLALTSKKPGPELGTMIGRARMVEGKTQCINHFRINDSWHLVDLPGYGYAVAPHEVRTDWSKFTKDYFLNRSTLVSVFLLIDASIPAKQIDLEYAGWLGQHQIPMTIIFTKCDKRKKKKNGGKRPEENVQDFQELIRDFFQAAPPWIMTSSVTNQGRDEILLHMAQLRNYWLKH